MNSTGCTDGKSIIAALNILSLTKGHKLVVCNVLRNEGTQEKLQEDNPAYFFY